MPKIHPPQPIKGRPGMNVNLVVRDIYFDAFLDRLERTKHSIVQRQRSHRSSHGSASSLR